MTPTETPEAPTTKVRAPKTTRPRKPRERLTTEQQELATNYMPLARKLAKHLKMHWPIYFEELDSAACLAMVEAAQAFDPERGVKFATFARMRILGALCDAKRRIHAKAVERPLPNVPRVYRYIPGVVERCMLMLTSPDPEVGTELEAIEEVEYWLRALPARHAKICREIYLNNLSQAEVAKRHGCAKSRISHLHAEAIRILHDSYAVQDAAHEHGLDVSRN
jgi:RNA polymerase sigma factor (sigma-70 family)